MTRTNSQACRLGLGVGLLFYLMQVPALGRDHRRKDEKMDIPPEFENSAVTMKLFHVVAEQVKHLTLVCRELSERVVELEKALANKEVEKP